MFFDICVVLLEVLLGDQYGRSIGLFLYMQPVFNSNSSVGLNRTHLNTHISYIIINLVYVDVANIFT